MESVKKIMKTFSIGGTIIGILLFFLVPILLSQVVGMRIEDSQKITSENIAAVANRDYAANAFIYAAKENKWKENAITGVLAYMLAEGLGPMGTFTYESFYVVQGPSGKTNDLTLGNKEWIDWMNSSGKQQMRETSYAYRNDIYCAFGIGLLADSDVWKTPSTKTVTGATNLIDYAKKKGRPWQDPQTQMEYYFEYSFKQPTVFDTKGVDPTKDNRSEEEWCRRITCGYGMPAWSWTEQNSFVDAHVAQLPLAREYMRNYSDDFKYINVSGGALAEDPNFSSNKEAWTSKNPFYPHCSGQCTWFAWGRFYEIYGYDPGFRNNGSFCAKELQSAHPESFEISKKPKAGAVFSTSKNTYGHVGIVIDVQGDTIIVQEGNYGPQQWNYPSFIKHGIGECYTNAGWRTSIYNVNSLNAVYANPK